MIGSRHTCAMAAPPTLPAAGRADPYFRSEMHRQKNPASQKSPLTPSHLVCTLSNE